MEIQPSLEVPVVSVFFPEQRTELERQGFKVFELQGRSISSLKRDGVSFWSNWHNSLALEDDISRFSEVAINVNYPFLPGSGDLTLSEQLFLVEEFNQSPFIKTLGVQAIIGSAIDYVDLDFCCMIQTGRSLFRRSGSFDLVSTLTPGPDDSFLFVGRSFGGSPIVSYRLGKPLHSDVKVIPLIIPKV